MSRQQSAFTLGDLLAQEDLGLEMLTGGAQALERRVAGAHSIEIDHPATWLERDWIMLTTGVRLRHSAGAQRLLIAELEAGGRRRSASAWSSCSGACPRRCWPRPAPARSRSSRRR